MQHFQSILIVIGLIAIGGVLIHGYLVSRKEKAEVTERGTKIDIFADESSPEVDVNEESVSEMYIVDQDNSEPTENIDFSVALDDEKEDSIAFSSIDEEVVNNEFNSIENEPSIPEIENDLDEQFIEINEETQTELTTPVEPKPVDEPKQDLFIFNVVAKEGKELGGHELLQFFLTSGFRHGEMAIFHRHENSDGTGPVLFSIANMMAPGVFDTDNMEQFRSEGVSFFLTAPNDEINVRKSFGMMLRAVEQMAEEFDCNVLNANREIMTTEQFIDYNNRLTHYV